MFFNKRILMVLFALSFLSSCGTTPKPPKISYDNYKGYYKVGNPYQIDGTWYYPKEQPDYNEVGISSWYGDEFHGKNTANGDTFDKHSLTAAHNTLPLPSMVRVTNLENNKTLILMVNDRGPFAKGRVIDVSERAAEILGYKDKGIAKVRVQFLKGQTNRLLAGLRKAPPEKESGFSLFKKEENPSYIVDDGEGSSKNKILKPVKKLSDMLSSTPTPTPTPASEFASPGLSGWPEIKIDDVSKVNDSVESKKQPDSNDSDEDSIKTIGSWQGDIKSEEIEETIKNVDKDILDIKPVESVSSVRKKSKIKTLPETKQNFIQAGTYGDISNAYRVKKSLVVLGDVFLSTVMVGDRELYRVRLGPVGSDKIAKIALQKVVSLGHPDAMIIKELPSEQ